jgi:hypothetical protein
MIEILNDVCKDCCGYNGGFYMNCIDPIRKYYEIIKLKVRQLFHHVSVNDKMEGRKEEMKDDPIHDAAKKLMHKKHEILDLFCKTFILSKEPKTIEEIKWIFENYVLDMRILSTNEAQMGCQYKLVRKEEND